MFSASTKSGRNSGATVDAQFNYVTMLLHGDGTNGAQNNTFLDSSTNAFSITRNGNTTQGSFSPYGSNWSNYFNGAPSALSLPVNAGTSLTGDFTIECWIFQTATAPIYDGGIFSRGAASSAAGYVFGIKTGNYLTFYLNYAGYDVTSSATISLNTWTHVAVSRTGTSLKLFINGVNDGSVTTSATPTMGGSDVTYIGCTSYSLISQRAFTGNISNLRVVKGTGLYSSNFIPSTTPLTAISGTELLTCQSNRFLDNSSNALTVSVATGSPSVQRFNPFGTSTAYSTSVIGGSGYFDGSGDYLTATLTGQTFGTGNFTAEGWFYQTANVSYNTLMAQRATANSATGWIVGSDSGGSVYAYSNGFLIGPIGTAIKNQWNHIAFVRSSGTMTLYLNGVSLGTSATSKTFSDTFAGIGGDGTDVYVLSGYASNVRYVVGTAVYTTTFTPPTAPLTAISGTSLLTNFTNGAIFDNAMMNNLETVGNAQISTSVVKYGTGSLYFDGTGDCLTTPSSVNLNFGTGNFTIEMWVYATTIPAYSSAAFLLDARTNASWNVFLASSTLYFSNSSGTETSGGTVSTNAWYHIAICRASGTTKGFVNGVQAFTFSDSGSYVGAPILTIGARYTNTLGLNGYIDDLRITNGYARYTTTFTPPTAAFPNTGPV